ncbi:DUF2802 domain-containing protein [Alteromonas facilis]|uniref:DUF2802 domain-containing protein n=1 Tax=Alteromonas facilis TaxID=2048004 RepID=UPI000C294D82|nr:DUF2802 domain-containing protein [Alteromonas facilis]
MTDISFIVAILALISVAISCFLLVRRVRSAEVKANERDEQLEHQLTLQMNHAHQQLRQQQQKSQEQISELSQQLDEMATSMAQLQQQLNDALIKLENIESNDPEVKLYQQARKLIASGADIDDIIEACGIPRAEIELLMSMDRKADT